MRRNRKKRVAINAENVYKMFRNQNERTWQCCRGSNKNNTVAGVYYSYLFK